jgi:Na+/proline symporter
MLAAKDEKNAIGATLLFNVAHYALRPWPWIVVALASIIVYPDLDSIRAEFPAITEEYLKDDVAYPVMLSKLSPGWLGLVVASLIAAYMSTIGTHLNWGSSYVVNDFYKRFMRPDATEKELVRMGRISTILLMVFSGGLSLTLLDNATQAFNILILSGAGSGAIYLLRWFWWRINAWTEIMAMLVASTIAIILVLFVNDESLAVGALDGFTVKLLINVGCTTVTWLLVTFLFPPEPKQTLRDFYRLTQPGGPGWKKVVKEAIAEGDNIDIEERGQAWEMPIQILCVFTGCLVVYSMLFSIGNFVYLRPQLGFILAAVSAGGIVVLFKSFSKLRAK